MWLQPAQRGGLLLGVSLVLGCAADAPAHDVLIVSNCNGPERSGRFHFPDTDFETHCSGGLLSGSCTTNFASGTRVEGEIEISSLRLTGLEEFGPSRYELTFEHPEGDYDPSPYGWRPIECYWYRDDNEPKYDDVGELHDCYFSARGCWAELDMLSSPPPR
jgi:hypothetical protein